MSRARRVDPSPTQPVAGEGERQRAGGWGSAGEGERQRAGGWGSAGEGERQRAGGREAARDALAELQRLVRVLERHAPVGAADACRDLDVLGDDCWIGRGEPHVRAATALLVTLASYQQLRTGRRRDARPAAMPQAPAATSNGRRQADPPSQTERDRQLAAAAARYIARDLAARQLSEFTSAEGYRLARALARTGGVEAPVERLLTEANQVRLHPLPLADALSHSPH